MDLARIEHGTARTRRRRRAGRAAATRASVHTSVRKRHRPRNQRHKERKQKENAQHPQRGRLQHTRARSIRTRAPAQSPDPPGSRARANWHAKKESEPRSLAWVEQVASVCVYLGLRFSTLAPSHPASTTLPPLQNLCLGFCRPLFLSIFRGLSTLPQPLAATPSASRSARSPPTPPTTRRPLRSRHPALTPSPLAFTAIQRPQLFSRASTPPRALSLPSFSLSLSSSITDSLATGTGHDIPTVAISKGPFGYPRSSPSRLWCVVPAALVHSTARISKSTSDGLVSLQRVPSLQSISPHCVT